MLGLEVQPKPTLPVGLLCHRWRFVLVFSQGASVFLQFEASKGGRPSFCASNKAQPAPKVRSPVCVVLSSNCLADAIPNDSLIGNHRGWFIGVIPSFPAEHSAS